MVRRSTLLMAGVVALVCSGARGVTFENSSHQMAAGNFDTSDADNELVFINAVDNWGSVTPGPIYVHDFNGGFSQQLPGLTAIQVIAADVTGDGRDEVVYINSSNQLGYYNFATSTNTLVPTALTFQDVTAGQIDADPQIELYTAENAGGSGGLRFYDAVTNTFSGAVGAAGNNMAANFNNNGLTDFAVRSGNNNASGALYTIVDPYGGFSSKGGGLNRIATGNLDGTVDAADEVLLTNSANRIYTHRINTPPFVQTTGSGTDPTVGNPEALSGGRELAYVIGGGNVIYQGRTTWNLGSGGTMTYTALRQTASNNSSAAVAGNSGFFDILAADVDNDGFDEIIGRKTADLGSTLFLFKNGTGALVQQNIFLTASDAPGTSSFAAAGHWSNAQAPQAGLNYDVGDGRTLRTAASGTQSFAGDSLNIYSGGTLSATAILDLGNTVLNVYDGGQVSTTNKLELSLGGDGTVNQTGGSVTVNNSHVVIGRYTTDVATYDMSGGTLQTTGGGDRNLYMAWDQAGVHGNLYLSNDAAVTLNGGNLYTGRGTSTITVADSAVLTAANGGGDGGIVIGRHGSNTATLTQTGGTVQTLNNHVILGRWDTAKAVYDISDGVLQTTGTGGNRRLHMAWDSAGSDAKLNVSGNGQVIVNKDNVAGATGFLAAERGIAEINISDNGSITVYGIGDGEGAMSLGRRGNSRATVNQSGGTVTLYDNHFIMGRWDNSQGTYNISDGVLKTAGTTGNRRMHLAWDSANSQATMNISGTGQVIVNEDRVNGATGFLIGNQGTAEVNISDNASVTVYGGGDGEGAMSLGLNGNASGTVNQTGGTVSLYDNFLMIGRRSTATGTYDLSGGTLTQTGSGDQNTYLGWDHATARGTLNVRGTGTANLGGNLYVGGNGTGEVTVDDTGSLNVPGAIYLGLNAGSTGTVNQSGGDVVVSGADGEGTGLIVGYGNNSNGTYDLSGGSVALSYGLTVGSRAGTVGNMTMSGGTLLTDFWVLVGRHGGTGTLTLSGDAEMTATLVRNNGRTHLGWQGGHGTLHLDGGTLTTSQIVKGDGTGTLYWNGGTVKVLPMPGAWGGFVESLDAAYIQAGGAILDTNGNNATISQPLLHDPALGGAPDGGLTKNGAGVLYLDGANTYTGPTTVNGGYLVARNNTALGTAAGGALVNSGATLQLEADVAGDVTITGETVTLNGTGVGGTRGALASWEGNNTWAGDVVLASDSSVYVYQHTLDISGQISGNSTLTKTGGGSAILTGASSNTNTGTTVAGEGYLVLNKTGGAYAISGPMQMGTGSGSPHLRTYQPNQFAPGVVMVGANPWGQWARFDLLGNDQTLAGITGETGGLVIQNGGVGVAAPSDATLTVNGDADSYFGGHMRDTDGTGGYTLSLVKQGAGTLTLAASPGGSRVNYTGSTTINAGTLTLQNLNGTWGFNSPITINPGGTLVVDSTVPFATRWNYGQTFSGSGTFIKKGTGVFGLDGPVSLSGQIQVQEGTLHNDNLRADWAGSTADVDISPGAILDLRGDHVTIDSLTGAGTVTNSYGHGVNVLTVGVANGSGAFSGPIAGSGNGSGEGQGLTSLVKEGTGAQTLSGNNTYGGTTDVNAGTLLLNGQHTGGGLYTVAAVATLGGTGTTTSQVDLSGAVAPGTSVGTLNTGSETWNDGGSFLFEINDVDAGPGTGWDLLNVTGSLDLTGLSNGGFEIDVASLGLDDLPGLVHDFNAGLPYEWEFVRTSDGIAGFQERDFVIDAGAFANPLSNIGSFIVYQKDDSLYLGHHVPEPSTLVLAALGLLGLGLAGWRRPRRS